MENTKQEDRIKELESNLKEINEADLLPEYYKNRIEEALKRERGEINYEKNLYYFRIVFCICTHKL